LPFVPGFGVVNAAGIQEQQSAVLDVRDPQPDTRIRTRVERDAPPPGVLTTAVRSAPG
jgi:hypothetical protein